MKEAFNTKFDQNNVLGPLVTLEVNILTTETICVNTLSVCRCVGMLTLNINFFPSYLLANLLTISRSLCFPCYLSVCLFVCLLVCQSVFLSLFLSFVTSFFLFECMCFST